jgi:cytochrome c oxidase subunit 2
VTGDPLPLGMFAPSGVGARDISPLLWGLIWLSVVVIVLIAVAVVAGIVVRAPGDRDPALVKVERSGNGLWWIYGGVGISTIVLIAFVGWTIATMAGIAKPPHPAAFTIEVSARQWWWGFKYDDVDPARVFSTANEIHIPVGVPVHFTLTSPDVIHSFWVPALGGKTDVIPGRTNEMWLEADKPGVYRGQCSEYCGEEHAQMALFVFAEPEAQFETWRAEQMKPAASVSGAAALGETQFVTNCGKCHTVRGSDAHGTAGPDLTHLMSRTTIAAGMLDNTIGNLSGWIADPQAIKPAAKMPNVDLSGPQLQSVLAYLETLH